MKRRDLTTILLASTTFLVLALMIVRLVPKEGFFAVIAFILSIYGINHKKAEKGLLI